MRVLAARSLGKTGNPHGFANYGCSTAGKPDVQRGVLNFPAPQRSNSPSHNAAWLKRKTRASLADLTRLGSVTCFNKDHQFDSIWILCGLIYICELALPGSLHGQASERYLRLGHINSYCKPLELVECFTAMDFHPFSKIFSKM